MIAASRAILGSPRFTNALTEAIIGVALAAFAVRAMLGWPGSIAVLSGLVVLAALSLAAQPERVEWRGVLPISLIALFSLMTVSLIWSQYTLATVGGVAYALAYGFLGVYIALVRDLIQLVRAVGNALRVILSVSFVLEILSGLIFDTSFLWIGITGDLGVGGPVQGLAGSRNAFAFLGALAVLSFWIEYRTRSVSRGVTAFSLTLAGATIVFAQSPVSLLVLAAVLVVGLALVVIRRQKPIARRATQSVMLVSVLVLGVLSWLFRGPIVGFVGAAADVEARTSVWSEVGDLVAQQPVLGWGWVGIWPTRVFPFSSVDSISGRDAASALNAYADIWLQLGLVGLIMLLASLGLAFMRAWLVATDRRSTVYVWPALTLVLLATVSMTESYLLFEAGLLLFVTSAFAAARNRSWRGRFD
ncbi:MAG: O-antigen ligase family protein [Microcella sp.]|uniref:O-antigen ligase family protein n=1 Tax=Microcella sp. TaxID=1913979 RepID=UPI0024CA7EF0|nr:O-antigen ligase family protein [Microcella sp.]UYN82558.1 MAG: O-antigen ligase family protein [Microcella sp.]